MNNQYQQIVDMGNEMITQNNRGTQYPMFVIQTQRERVGVEDYEEIDHYEYKICDKHDDFDEYDGETTAHENEVNDEIKDCYKCEKLPIHVYYEDTTHMTGVFFTEKAAQQHIDENHYHYMKPRIYGIGSWRNPEMITVQQQIISTTGKELPSHYA